MFYIFFYLFNLRSDFMGEFFDFVWCFYFFKFYVGVVKRKIELYMWVRY